MVEAASEDLIQLEKVLFSRRIIFARKGEGNEYALKFSRPVYVYLVFVVLAGECMAHSQSVILDPSSTLGFNHAQWIVSDTSKHCQLAYLSAIEKPTYSGVSCLIVIVRGIFYADIRPLGGSLSQRISYLEKPTSLAGA